MAFVSPILDCLVVSVSVLYGTQYQESKYYILLSIMGFVLPITDC